MRVTYLLALTILAVAITSTSGIPVQKHEPIPRDHRFPHFGFRERIRPHILKKHPNPKPPHFHTTESPNTEEVTATESEDTSVDITTIIPIVTEAETESESFTTDSETGTVSVDDPNADSTTKSNSIIGSTTNIA